MEKSSFKMPSTTRCGRVRMNHQRCKIIHRLNGRDVIGLQASGDIILMDPATGVRCAIIPPCGMTIEVTAKDQPENSIRTSLVPERQLTLTLKRDLTPVKRSKYFTSASYEMVPDGHNFRRDAIYVVEKSTLFDILASYALAGKPLPAAFAVPEDEIVDNTGRIIGYQHVVIYEPPRDEEVESLAVEGQMAFDLS